MFRCPHCHEPGVSIRDKLVGAPWSPAICVRCGGRSSEAMMPTRLVGALHGIAPFIVPVIALLLASWVPIILYLAFALVAHGTILAFAPLHALSDADVVESKSGRRNEIVVVLAILGVLVAAGWLLGG